MSRRVACPSCGTEVGPDWDWCHACGWDPDGRLGTPAARAATVAAPPPRATPPGRRGSTAGPLIIGAVVGVVGFVVVALVAVTVLGTPGTTSTFASVDGAIEPDDGPDVAEAPVVTDADGLPAADAWNRWTATDGSYSIDFPSPPQVDTPPIGRAGSVARAEQATANAGGVFYIASFVEYAPDREFVAPAEEILDDFVRQMMLDNGIVVYGARPSTFAYSTALEFEGESIVEGRQLAGVAFISGNRLYLLWVDAPIGAEVAGRRFFDSLTLA